ncbi:MAG: hypothetical protein [Microviridae sp.]|nr:MAG: hypothetical protein [Microviridae sp.]
MVRKKDILNTIISLGIMFLVGGCMMIVVISQSNSGSGRSPEVTNSNMDLGNAIPSIAPKNKKSETPKKHKTKEVCDTTKAKEARTTQEDEASHCLQ